MDHAFAFEERVESVYLPCIEGVASIVSNGDGGWRIGAITLDAYSEEGKPVEVELPETHRLYSMISLYLLRTQHNVIDLDWGRYMRFAEVA